MRVYLRLFCAFIALALLVVSGAGVFYVWEKMIYPEKEIEEEIVQIRKQKKKKIDHGARTYKEAMALFSTGALGGGVEKLHELMKFYNDSGFYPEAKRVVGEFNIDRLLSKSLTPGKHEYIVKRGDSLRGIAQDKNSTVGYIIHVNGRMGSNLQRGDQLIVSPLDFTVLISLSAGTLTLQAGGGEFFKEYQMERYRFPSNVPAQFDTKIQALIVGTGDTLLPVGSIRYAEAAKELRCLRRGIPLRATVADSEANKYVTGFFLGREDIEELILLIRPGTNVHVRK